MRHNGDGTKGDGSLVSLSMRQENRPPVSWSVATRQSALRASVEVLLTGKVELFDEKLLVPIKGMLFIDEQHGLLVHDLIYAAVGQGSVIMRGKHGALPTRRAVRLLPSEKGWR